MGHCLSQTFFLDIALEVIIIFYFLATALGA